MSHGAGGRQVSGTSGMSSAQLMREILTYQQTAQKLRAELAAAEHARLIEDRLKFEALAELDDVRAELHEAESRECTLRADLATVTEERDSAQTHLKISCLELDGSEAEFEAERAAHAETRKALEFHVKAYDLERTSHAETRKALHRETCRHADCEIAWLEVESSRQATQAMLSAAEKDLESTRAKLAKTEARIGRALVMAAKWERFGDGSSRSFADEMRKTLIADG